MRRGKVKRKDDRGPAKGCGKGTEANLEVSKKVRRFAMERHKRFGRYRNKRCDRSQTKERTREPTSTAGLASIPGRNSPLDQRELLPTANLRLAGGKKRRITVGYFINKTNTIGERAVHDGGGARVAAGVDKT